MVISPVHALAVRRALIASAVLVATLGAHALGSGEFGLTPGAPFIWAQAVLVATLLGARSGWRVRGFARCLGLLVGLQVVGHTVLTVAPWAFGLSVHHQITIGVIPVVFHLLAALALAGLVAYAERLLDAATRIVQAVVRALRVVSSGRSPRTLGSVEITSSSSLYLRRPSRVRGPPR